MTTILIQSRLGSTRLPMKALLPLGDSTVLGQVIRRCKRSKADRVIVVTQDYEIAEMASAEDVDFCMTKTRERDVLSEMYWAAAGSDTIVRITGDCPCVSPKDIDQMIDLYKDEDCDIMCNHSDAIAGAGIDGLDIEVFSFAALQECFEKATNGCDREHVTPWMYHNLRHEQPFVCWDFDAKLSIDVEEDYKLVFHIFEKLGSEFETRDLLEYFRKEKENEDNVQNL